MAGSKKWPAVLLLLAVGLTACGGGGGSDGDARRGNADSAAQAASGGERLYSNRCMVCHGGDLKGGFGPELRGIGELRSRDELIAAIRDGTGLMPAFRDRLTEEEIAAIVDWIREQ